MKENEKNLIDITYSRIAFAQAEKFRNSPFRKTLDIRSISDIPK